MSHSQRYELWMYEDVKTIKEDKLYLVRNKQTEELAVKRYIRKELIPVYQALKEKRSLYLPIIYEIQIENLRGIVITEFIQGITLQKILDENGHILDTDVRSYAIQICEALETLQEQEPKIIHRDIKPENLIVTDSGRIKLIDFDAARIYNNYSETDTEYIGTQGYAAPEQYGFSQTDERSDIYALGIVLQRIVGKKSREWNKVIQKCTNMDPNKRYQNAAQLKRALEHIGKKRKISVIVLVTLFAISAIISISLYSNDKHSEKDYQGIDITKEQAIEEIEETNSYWLPVPTNLDIKQIDKKENISFYIVTLTQTENMAPFVILYLQDQNENLIAIASFMSRDQEAYDERFGDPTVMSGWEFAFINTVFTRDNISDYHAENVVRTLWDEGECYYNNLYLKRTLSSGCIAIYGMNKNDEMKVLEMIEDSETLQKELEKIGIFNIRT